MSRSWTFRQAITWCTCKYGIAKFESLQTLKQDDRAEEYLTLKFAGNATLHVPASQIQLVQKYVGSSGIKPHLSHLGGTRWKQTKEKVRRGDRGTGPGDAAGAGAAAGPAGHCLSG